MPDKPPNILLLVSDQHLYRVAGYMGDKNAHTPNLDALALAGMVFERAYCQSPACTPSRASFLTGKYCHHTHCWQNHAPLFPEHKTIAHYLTAAGYATCLVGKMHFGGKDQMHGFERRPYGDLCHGLSHQPDPIEGFPNMQSAKTWSGPAEIPESLIQEVVTSTEAVAFVKEQAAARPDQPWFLCASYCRPHAPLAVPGRFHRRSAGRVPNVTLEEADEAGREEYPTLVRNSGNLHTLPTAQNIRGREAYYACVDFVDDCIGSVVRELRREGLLENTVIVYLSDHGEGAGYHGLWNKGYHYEEAVRAPFLMSGPGIGPGGRSPALVGLIDLVPTLLELCRVPLPPDLDGVSLVPCLRGQRDFAPHDALISEYLGVTSVDRAAYARASGKPFPSFRSVITDRFKYTETLEAGSQGPILFDLAADPREFRNVVNDPEFAGVAAALKSRLDEEHTIAEWAEIARQDSERAKDYRDGVKPTVPNQYMLADGRIFDAEKSLYDARWLPVSNDGTAGYIPQRFH